MKTLVDEYNIFFKNNYLSVGEQISKLWHIRAIKYSLVIKKGKDELWIHRTAWVNLRNIMWNRKNQSQIYAKFTNRQKAIVTEITIAVACES